MRRVLLLMMSAACASGFILTTGAYADIVVDLKNGVVTETFNTAPTPAPISDPALSGYAGASGYAKITLSKKPAAGCPSTPYEAKLEVNLAPANVAPLKKLSVLVEYEGTPTLYHTHLGDDSANDMYGGGKALAGVSELQVIAQDLAVYSVGLAPGKVDKLYGAQLSLTEGGLHFNVSNQELAISQPYTVLQSPFQKQLFDFGAPDKAIFAAFNRVIADGSSRKGCGVKRVHLSFE